MEDYKEKIRNLYNKVRFSALLEDSLLAKKLEESFPELKEENEDERIRKAISQCVEDMRGQFEKLYSVHHKDAIAWLKKQGEQKSYASETMNEKGDFDNGFTRMMEKEQKPADEELKKLLRAEYEKGRAKGKAQTLCEMPKEIDSQVWQIANNAAITWEQSFAILTAAKNAYDKGKADAIVQTPPVWSEEDEIKIESIIAFLKSPSLCAMEGNKDIIDANIKYLKSFKHQNRWKPNEEQMDALRYVTNFDYGGHKATLVSLYEQLKKLRGE